MDKKTKSRVQGVAVFLVFLAIATAIIEYKNKEGRPQNFNFKPAQQEYRDLKFINKAQVTFIANDVLRAQDEIDRIIANHAVKQIRKQNETSFGAYIFSVPQKKLPELLDGLRGFGMISSQTEQIDTSLVNIDYENETTRLKSYEREQNDLDALRFPTDAQNRRKEALHSLIHQSRLNLDKLKDAENVLLFISLSPLQKESNVLLIIKVMSVSFFSWLVIYSVGMVIVYFGTRLLMMFLGAIGIKGIGAAGVGGNYQYGGYSSYQGRYSGRYGSSGKRKVKRVYKDRKSTSNPDENNTADK